VGGVFFNIEDNQAIVREDAVHRSEGKVGEMFVINGVELVLRHQPQEVREFKRGNAFGLKQYGKTCDEVVDARHVGEHVVGGGEIGLFALSGQLACEAHTEEVLDAVDAFGTRCSCGAGCRFDAEARDIARFAVLQ
jgi:hypothetical protein